MLALVVLTSKPNSDVHWGAADPRGCAQLLHGVDLAALSAAPCNDSLLVIDVNMVSLYATPRWGERTRR